MTVVRDSIPGRKLTNSTMENFARAIIKQALRDFIEGRTCEDDTDPEVFLDSRWCESLCGLTDINPSLLQTVLTRKDLVNPGHSRGLKRIKLTKGTLSIIAQSVKIASEKSGVSIYRITHALETQRICDGWTIKELFVVTSADTENTTGLKKVKARIGVV